MVFDFFKKNWIGAGAGLVIGLTNFGAKQISILLHKTSINIVQLFVKLPPCDLSGMPFPGMCADVISPEMYTNYTILAIIIFILLGAFIQSKIKR